MRRATIATIAAAAVLGFALGSSAPAHARLLDQAALRNEVGLSQPQLSPDGKRIAFMKSTLDFVKDDRHSQLMLLDVASGAIRPLTYDRTGVDSPRWSPTGDRIAFVADAGPSDNAQSQIFVMPLDGGDPLQVTKVDNGVDEFTWRPDGKAFAFVTQDSPKNKKQLDAHFDTFDVGDLDYKQTEAPVPSHLWTVSASGGAAHRLTSGSWSLSTTQGGPGAALSWSADGKTIAIEKLPNAVVGDSDSAVVALVDAKTGAVHDLPGQRPYSGAPTFSPRGDDLAVVFFPHGAFNSNPYLSLTSSAGGPGRVIGGQEHAVDFAAWTPDGSAIVYSGEDGAVNDVWYSPLVGAPSQYRLGGATFVGDATIGSHGAVAFVGTTPYEPSEIYYAPSPTSAARPLTHYNASFSKLQLGEMREVRWTGPGGFKEDGIVTLPPGYVAGRRYPLALEVHGGPQGASQLGFNSLAQLIAAHGIVVFEPNYRGSTNLGDAYQHAIYRDTGVGPGKDAMAGVATLDKAGVIDTSRMCVTGWSYGGYMTTWLESHYDVWKCAMSGAALTDWVADYTIAFYQKGDADFFGQGSSPWKNNGWDIWRDQSPLSAVQNVKAPTLIMGDVGDPNVPIYNSYLWYNALHDQGVDVQFYAYPRNTHFPGDPVGAEGVYKRWVDWVVSHLSK
ncbi:MAG TPA: S9 family peptidase [Candidatus Eremiobacteraceae bacterium]|nr:S9 family peptidase [Candidatus Eremiobacteraceae bacterium]